MREVKQKRATLLGQLLTTARYDFNVHEKRILYFCIEAAQRCFMGEKLNRRTSAATLRHKPPEEIVMPISAVLPGEENKNNYLIKAALYSLLEKRISYNSGGWEVAFTLLCQFAISNSGETARLWVSPMFWELAFDFSKGFHPLELEVAMTLSSFYSMRFYELVSNARKGFEPVVSIDEIREWFGLQDEYPNNSHFIKYVIASAQKDLDSHAPWSFDFEPVKEGRRITKIRIKPRRCPGNCSDETDRAAADRRVNFSWTVPDNNVRRYLYDTVGFSHQELINNRKAWGEAYSLLGGEGLYDLVRRAYAGARIKEKKGELKKDCRNYVMGTIYRFLDAEKAKAEKEAENRVADIARDLADQFDAFK